MPRLNATADLLRHKIKQCGKRIAEWTQMAEDLQLDLEKINRWIANEQGDLEDAQTMLDRAEKRI